MGHSVFCIVYINQEIFVGSFCIVYIVASHLQRGSAIRWREDIEMDVAKISGGASNLAGDTKTHQDFVVLVLKWYNRWVEVT